VVASGPSLEATDITMDTTPARPDAETTPIQAISRSPTALLVTTPTAVCGQVSIARVEVSRQNAGCQMVIMRMLLSVVNGCP